MNSLGQAILDGRVAEVRSLVQGEPSLLKGRSPGGGSLLELARNKGVAEIIVVLLQAGAPGSESFADYPELMRAWLMELSEAWTSAAWYSGMEHILWSLIVGDRESFAFSAYHHPFSLGAEEKAAWRFLADKAGGWPTYEALLPLEAWQELYEKQRP